MGAHLADLGRTLPPTALSGVCALVVDDDLDAREILAAILEGSGALVRTASSADEAIVALGELRPQVIVSDIGMPEQDGYALLRRIRALPDAHGGGTPALAVTAYATLVDRRRALDAGFQRFLAKPVDPEVLVAAVVDLARAVDGAAVLTP